MKLRSLATEHVQAMHTDRHRRLSECGGIARLCERERGRYVHTELSRRSLGRETRASVGRCPGPTTAYYRCPLDITLRANTTTFYLEDLTAFCSNLKYKMLHKNVKYLFFVGRYNTICVL